MEYIIGVKLFLLQLLKFLGNVLEWLVFYDVFVVLVDLYKKLSNVQKFMYLRLCFFGRVLKCIEGYFVMNDNYLKVF